MKGGVVSAVEVWECHFERLAKKEFGCFVKVEWVVVNIWPPTFRVRVVGFVA